jgi:hypothetical protein
MSEREQTVTKKRSHRARWVEGLDWMRVEQGIIDPDFGGSPELYTKLLAEMLNYLPGANPDLDDVIHAEGMRRIEAGEMSDEQAECYVEALRRSAEENGRLINKIEKLLRREHLHVVE